MIGDRVNRVQNQPWISNLAVKGLSTTWRYVSFRSSPCRLAILAVLFNCPKSSILGRSERTIDCQARSILSLWSSNISLSFSGGIKSGEPLAKLLLKFSVLLFRRLPLLQMAQISVPKLPAVSASSMWQLDPAAPQVAGNPPSQISHFQQDHAQKVSHFASFLVPPCAKMIFQESIKRRSVSSTCWKCL